MLTETQTAEFTSTLPTTAEKIEQYFGTDRDTWKLLSLQARLKSAKTPETKAAIVEAIQGTIRSMAFIYTEVHSEGYRAGVQFGRENASFYQSVEQFQKRSPHRKVTIRTVNGRPAMSVNGRSID